MLISDPPNICSSYSMFRCIKCKNTILFGLLIIQMVRLILLGFFIYIPDIMGIITKYN